MFLFLVENFSLQSPEKSRSVFCLPSRHESETELLTVRKRVDSFLNSDTGVSSFFWVYLISILLSLCLDIYIFAYEKERREKTVDTMQTPYARARVCVCVRVNCCCFCFRHWKDGLCARATVQHIYLSIWHVCVPVWTFGWYWFMFEWEKKKKKKKKKKNEATYLPNIVTSELLLTLDRGIIHWRHR